MASGIWALNKAMGCGRGRVESRTLDNGLTQKPKVSVSMSGVTEINTRGNGSNVSAMAMDQISLPMVTAM